jgi:hypothetical protein
MRQLAMLLLVAAASRAQNPFASDPKASKPGGGRSGFSARPAMEFTPRAGAGRI